MARYAVAYIRKSKRNDDSATAQLAAVRDIARRDGTDPDSLVVLDDNGKSGDIKKIGARRGYAGLCDAIERGDVSTIYVRVLDRLGRDTGEGLRLYELIERKRTRLVDSLGEMVGEQGEDRVMMELWAAKKELRRAKERSAFTKSIRARRGDVMRDGQPLLGGNFAAYGYKRVRDRNDQNGQRIIEVANPEEPVQPLIEAARETRGNVLQAAKLLNARGIASRSGRPWSSRTLSRVLDREGVVRGKYGARLRRAPSTAPLARLVACHCGQLMTPVRDRRTGRWSELYCAVGHKVGVGDHGRYVARARHVMERLHSEKPLRVSRIHILKRAKVEDAAAQRTALEEKRRRLGVVFTDGALDEDDYRRQVDDVKRALAELDEEADADWIGFGPLTPIVPWDGDEEELGAALRQRVRVVRLDKEMHPGEVVWRNVHTPSQER
jgi:DNA invertase Pin-like site-specific DNA recombinase